MKAIIESVRFVKSYPNSFLYEIGYNGRKALYYSKSKEQGEFVIGVEAEFIEEERSGKNGKYTSIKLMTGNKFSNFGKALKKEQSRYSGFSDSYIKDMIVAGMLKPEATEEDAIYNDIVMATWKSRAFEIFEHMVSLDKTLEQ